jgi:hypothetical protein
MPGVLLSCLSAVSTASRSTTTVALYPTVAGFRARGCAGIALPLVEDQRPLRTWEGIIACDLFHLVGIVGTLLAGSLCSPVLAQTLTGTSSSPRPIVWRDFASGLARSRFYAEAREGFIAGGDERNVVYAEAIRLRGQLPTLAVADVSERLSDDLENPLDHMERPTSALHLTRVMGLIRIGGHLSCGGCDVQTDGRHTQATSASLVHRGDSAPRHPSEEALAVRAAR